jgi:hypothetical protein
MACNGAAVIFGASALQGELDSFSDLEVLRALYEKMCVAGGVNCDPLTYLSAVDPCVACLSEQQLLSGITTMVCAR